MDETALEQALERAIHEDWQAAGASLDGVDGPIADKVRVLVHSLEANQRSRRAAQSEMRHELGNAITIALANVDSMVDGALPVTPKRLQNVGDALRRAQRLLQ